MFERAANAQHTRFDVDGFIATLFRAVHDEDVRAYVHCTQLTRKIAKMFTNSAISAGVDDPELIKKYLCRLLLSNSDSDCITAEFLYGFGDNQDGSFIQNVLSERYRLLLHTLKACDIQHLVNSIVQQQEPSWANSIIDLIVSCSRENFDINYLQDFIAVFNFLAHPENMKPYIDSLEASLQSYAATLPSAATFALRDDGKYLLPASSANPYKCHGILSGFLYQWACDNGFQQRAKMLAGLSSETFFSLLTSKSIFKDNAVIVGDFHGAWSHILQWFLIIEHHKHLAFLRHSPIEIYQKLGDQIFLVASAPVPQPWDIIHDAYNKNNFTSPEFMTHYFLDQSANSQWPLLSESIRRMQAKMFHKFGNEDGYTLHLRNKHAISNGAAFVVKRLP